MKKIEVVELFAGVGGFRLGLEGWNGKSASSNYKDDINSLYEVIWSNQWEPATKTQHASMIYEFRWGKDNHSNENIEDVDINKIPDHDLLVGGFPCQDYSVATTLKNSKGLMGKKGVLWWSIHKILENKRPKYLLLENVDRLLISPSGQRGRDFAVILQSLNQLGYIVEWRVINAAEYGMPQRRKRIFILAYLKKSAIGETVIENSKSEWIMREGVLAKAFPVSPHNFLPPIEFSLINNLVEISESWNRSTQYGTFENTGIMVDGDIWNIKTVSSYNGRYMKLKDVLLDEREVAADFFIQDADLDKWVYLKGSKKETRKNSKGFEYKYSEGSMLFPDSFEKASRTIITGEGGPSPSRFKHVVRTTKGFRRLTPIELERLDMFPDNHTLLNGITDSKRAFFMGNALVVGIVERIGLELQNRIKKLS